MGAAPTASPLGVGASARPFHRIVAQYAQTTLLLTNVLSLIWNTSAKFLLFMSKNTSKIMSRTIRNGIKNNLHTGVDKV